MEKNSRCPSRSPKLREVKSPPCALHTSSSRPFPLAPHFHPPEEEEGEGCRAGASLLKTAWIQGGAEREGDGGEEGGGADSVVVT